MLPVTSSDHTSWGCYSHNCVRQALLKIIAEPVFFCLVYDSSAKYPSGVLIGVVTELGRFDWCMSASFEQFEIYGAYAVADVRFRLINSPVAPPTENKERSIVNFVETHWARSKVNDDDDNDENTWAEWHEKMRIDPKLTFVDRHRTL